jgi:dTMP kinase
MGCGLLPAEWHTVFRKELLKVYAPGAIFIAVEGIDGAGKTTQVEMLRSALLRSGEAPVVSKEPTNGQWGKILRQSASEGRLPLTEELELFIKDRSEHVNALINPALAAGRIVILDRYFYSTIAYQGARGADALQVEALMVSTFPVPDAVFLLDVDPTVGVNRIANSRGEEPNHFEQRESLGIAREIFNSLTGDHIHRIDGTASIEDIHSLILDKFIEGPLRMKRCAKSYGCDDQFNCSFRLAGTCAWFNRTRALKRSTELAAG